MVNSMYFKEIKNILENDNNIAISVHVHPDGDALGSMLALYEVLCFWKKNVVMVIDDIVPEKFKKLPFADKIIHVKDLKSQGNYDRLVVLDASTIERIGKVAEAINAPILNIDHHISNTKYAEYLWLDSKAAATGEMLVALFKEWNIKFTKTMANSLYMAIATDCGFFKFSNTTKETLLAAAYCVEHGAEPQYITNIVEITKQNRLKAIQRVLETIRYEASGRVAFMAVDYQVMQLVNDDTDGFIELIRNVEGVDVAVLFKQYSSKQTRISFRSKVTDVNKVASIFNGGGHIRAAGCTIKQPLDEAMDEVARVLDKVIGENK